MSARLLPVSWTRAKIAYDVVLGVAVVGYLLAFLYLAPLLADPNAPLDPPTLSLRAFGSLAFLLLTAALCIGPLARLDRRFLPLLYNRRHLGVVTFLVALAHAAEVLGWYFAFSPTPPLVALLSSEPLAGPGHAPPFVPFGVVALLILFALAATSHDFWLAYLGPTSWKWLHMAIYPAYALVVAHVAWGYLQSSTGPVFPLVMLGSGGLVTGLHLAAARAGQRAEVVSAAQDTGWLRVGPCDAIPEGRAVILRPEVGDPIAVFRHAGRLVAVTNLCAHQNGPLGEGRILDGCITCPWHGFQYRFEDGCAPPPYTERLATYPLRIEGRDVLVHPEPHPPGMPAEPVALPGSP
ncbi:Rieske 2Fe-2S domain-containing protein [Roseomonas sp. CCTCC AB2023176]|uniref:Rieske 2Fe-2S domain-containing protein n=1 Tax=Roseomonas sp. CCTCC AB2023176 TaxID=3342640 RepID=UPI0035DFFE08